VSLKDQLEPVGGRQGSVEGQPRPVEEQPRTVEEQPRTVEGPSGTVDERRTPVDHGLRGTIVQPRLLIGLTLIAAGLVWAVLRGLEFYGLSAVNLAYDVDQPPILLVLVGAWLLYRSRLE
jgi:hypothetical protein